MIRNKRDVVRLESEIMHIHDYLNTLTEDHFNQKIIEVHCKIKCNN